MNKSRYYPLHYAAMNNQLVKCVKILVEFGAHINGFMTKIEAHVRFKRTPLIHACMYENAHIVSHLLRMGTNANVFDSSMNTALHYAIAYGWYFCVRLLFEADTNLNCANCWQTICLRVDFSKGHHGICDYLLTEYQADINLKTDDGLTLVIITVDVEISASSLQQLEYVVVKHKADSKLELNLDVSHDETSTRLYLTVIKHLLIENNLSNFVIDACIASNHLDLLITFLHQPIDIDLKNSLLKSIVTTSEIVNRKSWIWNFASISKNKSIKKYSLIHLIIQRNWQESSTTRSSFNKEFFRILITSVKFLLELDTDVNFSDEEKRITLIYDVRQNNIDMVKLLLNKIYNPNDNLH
ncbi:unnamed protein product [Rotaria sp. Silwood1]|nr:unnamed protein product [Rotaria sp. Silwood1]CAF4722569.1 unnamed protein product [Rotaria sp. Silwood1]